MKLTRGQQVLLGLVLVVYAVTLRLLPHPANFAPMTAVAIFGGAYMSRPQAVATTLAAAVLSDAVMGFYTVDVMAVVWVSYAFIALGARRWMRGPNLVRGGLVTLAGSTFFFLTTNFAVWATGGLYAHNWTGLERCFALALPFFRNSLFGDLFYTGALFGIAALIIALSHQIESRAKQRA